MVSPTFLWVLDHLPGRKCICSWFPVAGSIVKKEECSRKAIGSGLENVNGTINLNQKII
jgi:hypothetical protein